MRVLAVATHSERWFPGFVESCRRHGLPLNVLGWGEKWRGFAWRFRLYQRLLAQLPPEELVLITDAFDTVMLAGPAEIEDRFRQFQTNILFSTEPTTWYVFELLKSQLFGSYNGRIVNGGTYMGKAGALLSMMRQLDFSDDSDDQALLTAHCNRNQSAVDWRGELFLHYLDVFPSPTLDSLELYNGRLYTWPDKGPRTCPVLITVAAACNGPRGLLLELGYDETLLPHIPNRDRWKKVQLYFPTKWVLLIITIVVLFVFWRRQRSRGS